MDSVYKTAQFDDFGRSLIATRDLAVHEMILKEVPFIVSPADDSQNPMGKSGCGSVICLGCLLPGAQNRCSKCRWPVCSRLCEEIPHHAENECRIFAWNSCSFPPPRGWPILYKTVFVLRCLLVKQSCRQVWNDNFLKLEHHSGVRAKKSVCSRGDAMLMENFRWIYRHRRSHCPWTEAEIKMISGILNVNSFLAVRGNRRAKCLFLESSLMAHSCVPNCRWDIKISAQGQPSMEVHANVSIKAGDILSISYSTRYLKFGTLKRVVSMEEVAHFVCKCDRCADPSELGTFTSAVKCFHCCQDYMLPSNAVEPESFWTCATCQSSCPVDKVVAFVCKVEDQLDLILEEIHASTSNNVEPALLDRLFDLYSLHYEKTLHPNHYILQEISNKILKIIWHDGISLEPLSDFLLDKFLFHCNHVISSAKILAPGQNSYQDKLERYLHAATSEIEARKSKQNVSV